MSSPKTDSAQSVTNADKMAAITAIVGDADEELLMMLNKLSLEKQIKPIFMISINNEPRQVYQNGNKMYYLNTAEKPVYISEDSKSKSTVKQIKAYQLAYKERLDVNMTVLRYKNEASEDEDISIDMKEHVKQLNEEFKKCEK